MNKIAEVFQQVQTLNLLSAARLLAESGIPIFPCVPGGKRPMTGHGFLDATTDTTQITSWWQHAPGANIGMPTGTVSGIDVVDVDVRPNGSGFEAFSHATSQGLTQGWAMAVRTPSGGLHLYYPSSIDDPQSCWTTSAKVDFRGNGGYVIIPPSVILVDGIPQRYEVIQIGDAPTPVDAARLRAAVDPQPTRHRVQSRPQTVDAEGLPERMAAFIGSRTEGGRNGGLFWAACRMAEAGHDIGETHSVLSPVARRIGLFDREINTTIRSAYRTTISSPTAMSVPNPSPFPASRRQVVTL